VGKVKNAKNTRRSREEHTHTNPIHPILTPVARWTTPIESPGRDAKVEFPVRDWCWRKEIGEGERVGCTRISLTNIQIHNKSALITKGC
jgi:hypothetical protein